MKPSISKLLISDCDEESLRQALEETTGEPWGRLAPESLPDCREALLGAETVVVTAGSDGRCVELLHQAARIVGDATRLIPVFAEEASARLHESMRQVEPIGAQRLVAQHTIRRRPPVLRDRVAAPPIVIGDGTLAREIVLGIVTGWGYPGDPVTVHCVGSEPGWAHEAESESRRRASLTWSQIPLTPTVVVDRVRELLSLWEPPAQDQGESTQPTITIALDDSVVAMVLSQALARVFPDSRVIMVTSHTRLTDLIGVDVVSAPQVLATAMTGNYADDVLQGILLTDLAWECSESEPVTAPPVPLFDPPTMSPDGDAAPLSEQPNDLRAQLASFAEMVPSILAEAHLEVGEEPFWEPEPIVLSPSELSAMARVILRNRGLQDVADARLAALELAFRLPRLAARAGLVTRRIPGHESMLTYETIEKLAALVHHAYQGAAFDTNNATNSPYAYVGWRSLSEFQRSSNRSAVIGSAVAWAVEGFEWHQVPHAVPISLHPDQIDRLAELEHRRWAHHQRSNGRSRHKWVTDWEFLTPAQKHYDLEITRAMPRLLAMAGIEIRPFNLARYRHR